MTCRHLYVHVPFCARRCSYCDFSIAVRREVPVSEFVRSLATELSLKLHDQPRPRLDTLYLGGGTPSRLGPDGIAEVLAVAGRFADLEPNAELTIEVNPDDVTASAAAAWRSAGVNRVSLGVQSFDDNVLEWMHRIHDSAAAIQSFGTLRDAGFDNVSLDLIFALPDSLERSWERDLETALGLEPDHISLYGLTVEPSTPLARWSERGQVIPAGEDRYAEDFLLAHRMTESAGFEHYEVSNFAQPGKRSRHNSAYWTGSEYLGIGPSAHSFDGRSRIWNVRAYSEWVRALSGSRSPVEGQEKLSGTNRVAERVYLGLRTRTGIPLSDSDRASAARWSDAGWARIDGEVLRLTPEGWLRLDSLAAALTGL